MNIVPPQSWRLLTQGMFAWMILGIGMFMSQLSAQITSTSVPGALPQVSPSQNGPRNVQGAPGNWLQEGPAATALPNSLPPAADVVVSYPYPESTQEPLLPPEAILTHTTPDVWYWQVVPEGLIYRSYQAGPREPKISTVIHQEDGTTYWDPIVGGRVGLLRFGTGDSLNPQGWQLDAEGAAMLRLNVDENVDVDATDYRFGFPITYGVGKWQFKFGYYHLSSHLGDEFSVRNPGVPRINYVRDAGFLGVAYFPEPWIRIYGEVASAFLFRDGGAEPWEFQFGTEMSRPGVTGNRGTPFLAINVHLLEELDFGGAITVQTGWLWRNRSGKTFRAGLHYHNGHSPQYQFLANSESQIGGGIWYDF